jgi:hypothetical protein
MQARAGHGNMPRPIRILPGQVLGGGSEGLGRKVCKDHRVARTG